MMTNFLHYKNSLSLFFVFRFIITFEIKWLLNSLNGIFFLLPFLVKCKCVQFVKERIYLFTRTAASLAGLWSMSYSFVLYSDTFYSFLLILIISSSNFCMGSLWNAVTCGEHCLWSLYPLYAQSSITKCKESCLLISQR